jgi:hypothetical protein
MRACGFSKPFCGVIAHYCAKVGNGNKPRRFVLDAHTDDIHSRNKKRPTSKTVYCVERQKEMFVLRFKLNLHI